MIVLSIEAIVIFWASIRIFKGLLALNWNHHQAKPVRLEQTTDLRECGSIIQDVFDYMQTHDDVEAHRCHSHASQIAEDRRAVSHQVATDIGDVGQTTAKLREATLRS